MKQKIVNEKTGLITKLSLFFIERYRITVLLLIGTLVFGFLAYTTFLKREGFPPINTPFAIVQTPYFVNNKDKVDTDITKPIINTLQDIDEIKSLSSNSSENFSSVNVRFEDSITSEAGSKIVSEILKSSSDLPESVEPSIITFEATKFNGKYDMIVSLLDINNSDDLVSLQTNAGELATELAKNDLVKETAVIELLTKQVNEQTGQEFLYQNGFDRTGFIKSEELEMFQSIQIGIIKKEDTNIDDLSKSVSSDVDKFNNNTSEYESIITGDFSELVNNQIKSLEENAISGLIAVVLIIFFFISWRASILGGIFIPTVLAATFIVFYLIGYSLNVISLFALILVIGILTDDAIIVIEAIDKKKREGLGKIDAIKSAINEIGVADIVGTVTTILVFIPMAFTSGILGDFIRLVPITVIIALALSLVIALTFIPYMSGIITFDLDIITKRIKFPRIPFVSTFFYYLFNGVGIIIEKSATLNAKFVSAYLSKKRFLIIVLIASLVLILGGGFFASKLKFSVFPAPKDTDQITAQISFQEGTKIEKAEEISIKVEDLILNSEYKEFVEQITYTTGNERRAEMSLNLTPIGSRSVTSVDMINGLTSDVEASKDFEGVDVRFSIVSAGPPAQEYPFAMQIYSESTEVLDATSKDISSYLMNLELDNGNKITAVRVDGIAVILRKDGKRFAEVRAKTTDSSDTALTLSIQSSVEAEYDSEKLSALGVEEPLGFDLGQESENLQSFQSAVIAFGVSIVIMFLLLVLLYNSYSQAILIFLAIPFSIPFLFPGLYLTDNPLSFFVTLGMIALVGITVNNTIMLIEFTNQNRKSMGIKDSVSEAVKVRFRPILTTTAVTVGGLLPLALNDPFWEGLALTIIFGLISSTVMVLLIYPSYYYLFEGAKVVRGKVVRKVMK